MRKLDVLKKFMALGLVAAMSLSLVACGSKQEQKDPAPSTGNEVTDDKKEEPADDKKDETAETPETPVETGYEAKDLGGRTIKIGIWWDEYYDSRYQTLEDIDEAGGNYSNSEVMQMKLDAVRKIEEKWNCKVEWVNFGWEGIKESINTSVTAGTPECDIYMCDLGFGLAPVLGGYAQKLSEVCPAEADVLTNQKIFTKVDAMGEDDYLFAPYSDVPGSVLFMGYNAEAVAEAGLEAPEALAERGEWTWDKFAEYAKACTKDKDGDGNPDVYGFGTTFMSAIRGFAASNNGVIAAPTEGLSSPQIVEVMNLMNRLYNEDKSARPYQDNWDDDLIQGWVQGKAVFTFVQPWMIRQEMGNYDYTMRICPTPVGPSGSADAAIYADASNSYFIPVGVEDPTSVYCVFEEMMNWNPENIDFGNDAADFETIFADEAQMELGYKLAGNTYTDFWGYIDPEGAVAGTFYDVVVTKDKTVAQAIESRKQVMQDEIDALMK